MFVFVIFVLVVVVVPAAAAALSFHIFRTMLENSIDLEHFFHVLS